MVSKKKNLLEAFQAAAPERRAARERVEPQAPAGGPFAPAAREERRTASPRFLAPGPPRRSGLARALSERSVRYGLLVCTVLVVAAYFAGRGGSAEKGAGGADPAGAAGSAAGGPGRLFDPGSEGHAGADLAQANLATASLGSAHDRAFMDRRNRFTVRVAQYVDDDHGRELAAATAEYLRKTEGLPVVGPIQQGRALVLCAGYAPATKELDQLLGYVKSLRGPAPQVKKPPFASAYLDNIDNVVARPR